MREDLKAQNLRQLKDLKTKALDVVMESGTPDSLAIALDQVSKKIGLRWNQDLQALPNFKQLKFDIMGYSMLEYPITKERII